MKAPRPGDTIRLRAQASDPWLYLTVTEIVSHVRDGSDYLIARDRQHWSAPVTLDLKYAFDLASSGNLEVKP
jgi:hypothetical protein